MRTAGVLLDANGNFLDDSVESGGDRESLRSLAGLGLTCDAVGRFTVVAAGETKPAHGGLSARAGAG
jgi:hypothetical protein